MHLLAFCLSNQYSGIVEDSLNKPWRPIPSGRISADRVQYFRCILIPLCLWFSFCDGPETFFASIVLILTTLLYNDCGLHRQWLGKNFSNALGYGAFELGAVAVARMYHIKLVRRVLTA